MLASHFTLHINGGLSHPGFYCMPSEGIELSPEGKLLTNNEILRLAELFVKSGVTKIRLTGGEPTVRKGITEIIGRSHGWLFTALPQLLQGASVNSVNLAFRLLP